MAKKAWVYSYAKPYKKIIEKEGYLETARNGKSCLMTEPLSEDWTYEEFAKKKIYSGLGEEGIFDGSKVWLSKPDKAKAINIFFQYEEKMAEECRNKARIHLNWMNFLNEELHKEIEAVEKKLEEARNVTSK